MSKLGPVALVIVVLVFLLAALPGDVGCSASADAPIVVRLWAATCEGGQP